MNEEITKLISQQICGEFYSAYLYLDFSNFYELAGLKGFANWFRIQAQEERDHALLFVDYLHKNSVPFPLLPIPAPKGNYSDFEAPLTLALEQEKGVTKSIEAIYQRASDLGEVRTTQFLDWFIGEQVEEEKTACDLCKRYTLFAADGRGLFLMDEEMKARIYTPSVITA